MTEAHRRGWEVGCTERQISPHVKRDLFGFADYAAATGEPGGTVLIQSTTYENRAQRRNKMLNDRTVMVRWCLKSGFRIELWAFGYLRVAGPNGRRWDCVTEQITLEDLPREVVR